MDYGIGRKKVLVIHPFVDTIKKQYEKRDKLFENSKLPTFESLECVRAIQSNAGENEAIEFSSYFDALESMKAEILKKDFQVAFAGRIDRDAGHRERSRHRSHVEDMAVSPPFHRSAEQVTEQGGGGHV